LCPIFIGFIHYGCSKLARLQSLPDSPLEVLFSLKNILIQKFKDRKITEEMYDEENKNLDEQIHQIQAKVYDKYVKARNLKEQLENLMKS